MMGTLIYQAYLMCTMIIKHVNHFGWFVVILLITACSSNIPVEIRQNMEGAPTVAQVRDQPEDYTSQRVRWGGVILEMENKQQSSGLRIIAFPLKDNGKPRMSDQSTGRFIAMVDEFLEPLVYSPERLITVTGELANSETHKVGEFPYLYPVIEVDSYHLWPKIPDPESVDYPTYWRYDPWFQPYYFPRYHPHRLIRHHH